MDVFKRHLPPLIKLALPVVATQLGFMLMGVVDTIMVGQFSTEALAASVIAGAWLFTLQWIGMGLIQGIDPLVTQAHGAGQDDHAIFALKRGVVLALFLSAPLLVILTYTEEALILIGQEENLAAQAQRYITAQAWSVPCFYLFIAFRQYFQGREIVKPMLWVTIGANAVNIIFNYFLIFGSAVNPAMGLVGAGLATGLTRAFMLIVLWVWATNQRLVPFHWLPNTKDIYKVDEFLKIFKVGVPVAAQIGFEVLAFNSTVFIAGLLGENVVAAHGIALNIASLAFMVPLGLSQATVTRVGNLIGAHKYTEAKHAAWVAIATGGIVMTLSALLFITLNKELPGFYINEELVVSIAATLLPIAGAFQIFDGIQVVCSGILRGMGRPLPSTFANLFAFWFIGLPIGYWTSIQLGYGVQALWWSLVIGLGLVAVILMGWIAWRGPEHHAVHFE